MSTTSDRTYIKTHPWVTFALDLNRAPYDFWLMLGECQSKCEHLAGVPLQPEEAKVFYQVYLAKGVLGTTAIEGNTLSEDEVRREIDGQLELPFSRQYLAQEVRNVVDACNQIAREAYPQGAATISADRIKQLDALVLRGLKLDPGVVPGEVSGHMVGVRRYRGCPREDCDYLLNRLAEWLNSREFGPFGQVDKIGVALIKAILAHLYLAWIHPFGDGNGRTARLLEFQILFASGVPGPAAHLLSNFYNQTRTEYYRQLEQASRSGGDVFPFLIYAIQGFRDGLREQIEKVRYLQWDVMWINYVYAHFRTTNTPADKRRRDLVLDLTEKEVVPTLSALRQVSPRMAEAYARKTQKTLTRDVNALIHMELISKDPDGYRAKRGLILAWLPPRVQDKEERPGTVSPVEPR